MKCSRPFFLMPNHSLLAISYLKNQISPKCIIQMILIPVKSRQTERRENSDIIGDKCDATINEIGYIADN
jgi:hypothetical protein